MRSGDTLEGLSEQVYGDNWRAGMAVIGGVNNLRQPILYAGGTVQAPSLDGLSCDALDRSSAAGDSIDSKNAAGLNRRSN